MVLPGAPFIARLRAMNDFRSAEGRSGAVGATTELPSLVPPIQPAVRAKPVKPTTTPKIDNPPINTGDLYF
jgi:hypothetical protein